MAEFKQLTPTSWRERDDTNEAFVHLDRGTGRLVHTSGDDWAGVFLSVTLDARVPKNVQDLFEVARGTLLYGHYFYPLYTLGEEQLHRVADAAAVHRYEQLGGRRTHRGEWPTFKARIRWLIEHGAIPQDEVRRWNAYREMRNITSHPQMQSLVMPGDALRSLQMVAASVNAIFRPATLRR